MKTILLAFSIVTTGTFMAQKDTLPSGVYSWSKAPVQMAGKIERRQVLTGSTLDLSTLEIHTSMLLPGESNHPPKASRDAEELIIIKDGKVKATVQDSTKMLGPGGVILLISGDKQSITNISDKPATYYVLAFRSKDGFNAQRAKAGGKSFMKD